MMIALTRSEWDLVEDMEYRWKIFKRSRKENKFKTDDSKTNGFISILEREKMIDDLLTIFLKDK